MLRPSIDELLSPAELPAYLKRLPTSPGVGTGVLVIQYAGISAVASILNGYLVTTVSGPYPMDLAHVKDFSTLADETTLTPTPINLNLNLSDYTTIAELAAEINSYNDYTSYPVPGSENVSPLLLIPASNLDISTTPTGLIIQYFGATALINIAGNFLTTTVTGPFPIDQVADVKDFTTLADPATLTPEPIDLNINLTGFATLAALAAYINGFNDYSCIVASVGVAINPAILSPITNQNFADGPTPLLFPATELPTLQADVGASSSLLSSLMLVFALALQKSMTNVEHGLEETCPTTADGMFLDLWGSLLGRIDRQFVYGSFVLETDSQFRSRLMKEVQRLRLSTDAIINAVIDGTGGIGSGGLAPILQNTQHNSVWILNDPVQGVLGSDGALSPERVPILIDRAHVQPLIYVVMPSPLPPQTHLGAATIDLIKQIIERNRMAGIEVSYAPIPNP